MYKELTEELKSSIDVILNYQLQSNTEGSILYEAVKNNNLLAVKKILQMTGDKEINKKTKNGWTCLHKAAVEGYTDILEELLKNGAKVNVKDSNNFVPLHWAVQNSNLTNIKALLEKSANPDKKESLHGWTPLHYAVLSNTLGKDKEPTKDLEIIKLLLEGNATIKGDKVGQNPLHIAVKTNRPDIIELFFKQDEDNKPYIPECNNEDSQRKTPLEIAIEQKNEPIINLLLKGRADVNKCLKTGYTPLYKVADEGDKNILDRLLEEENIDVDLKNTWVGLSALHKAAEKGHVGIIDSLLKRKANINKETEWGKYTPLHYAAVSGHIDATKKLLEHKDPEAKLDAQARSGIFWYTPIGLASDQAVKNILQNAIEERKKNI